MWIFKVLILGLLHLLLQNARRTSAAEVDCTHSGDFENAEDGPTTIAFGDMVTVNCKEGWVNAGATTVNDNNFSLTCTSDGIIDRSPSASVACMADIDECTPNPSDATNTCTLYNQTCTNNDASYECTDIVCNPMIQLVDPALSDIPIGTGAGVTACAEFYQNTDGTSTVTVDCANVAGIGVATINPNPHCSVCFYPGITNSNQTDNFTAADGDSPVTVNCNDGWKNPDNSTSTTMTCISTGWDNKPSDDPASACASDIDECADNTHNCSLPNACFNTDGGFLCISKVCGDPGDYANAHHPQVTAQADDMVTVTCLDGWHVTGGTTTDVTFTVTCASHGEWMPEEGKACTENINECDPVGTVCTNPGEKCKDSPGSYSCDCEDGYFWNNTAGMCEARECAAITPPANSVEVTVPAPLIVGEEAIYECDVGYQASHSQPDTANLRQFSVNCMDDGNVCGCSLPKCEVVDCGEPGNDPNSYHTTTAAVTTTYGSTLMYTCNPGYTTPTDTTYTKMCDENGNWVQDPDGEFCTENINECETMCDGPGEVCIDTIGSYYCLCLRGWQWNSLPLPSGMCVAQTCPTLPDLDKAIVDPAVTAPVDYGSGVKYTCTKGYKPSQDTDPADPTSFTVTCQDGGLFSGSGLPSCILVDCGVPNNDPKSSYLVSHTTYQSEIMYTCDPGYQWMSPAGTYKTTYTRECLETGAWSDVTNKCEDIDECAPGAADPKCTEKGTLCVNLPGSYLCQSASGAVSNCTNCLADECDPPPTKLENTEPVVIDGMTASYTCNPGYVTCCGEEKQVNLACAGHRWLPNSKGCQKRSCGDPGLDEHAKRTGSSFLFEDEVTYTCQSGFHVNGDVTKRKFTRECQADGTWSGLDLYCEDINECLNTTACGDGRGVLHTCTNTEGSYMCDCGGGYVLSGHHNCLRLTQVSVDGSKMAPCDMYEQLNLCGVGQCDYTAAPENQPICKCPSGVEGRWCDERVEMRPINWPLILSILSLGLLLLLSLVTIICFILQSNRLKAPPPYKPRLPARNSMILPPRRRFFPRNWW